MGRALSRLAVSLRRSSPQTPEGILQPYYSTKICNLTTLMMWRVLALYLAALVSGSLQSARYSYNTTDYLYHAQAAASCKTQGGRLWQPKSNDYLKVLERNVNTWNFGWIGLESKDGINWSYSDGTPLNDWAEAEISNSEYFAYYYIEGRTCAAFRTDDIMYVSMYRFDCEGSRLPYVCEYSWDSA